MSDTDENSVGEGTLQTPLSSSVKSSMKGAREKIRELGRQRAMQKINKMEDVNAQQLEAYERRKMPSESDEEYEKAAREGLGKIGAITASGKAPNVLSLPSRPAMNPLPRRPGESDPLGQPSPEAAWIYP